MSIRRSSIVLGALGVISIGGAVALHFVADAQFDQLPGNLDTTAKSAGTGTLLNPATLQTGDLGHMFLTDVPVATTLHNYVSHTAGNVAILHSDLSIAAPGNITMTSNHTYAVDRTTLGPADAPANTTVEKHDGLVISLPQHAETTTAYRLYDSVTTKAYPMTYVDTEKLSGRDVLRYDIAAVGAVADPALLKTMPPALPGAAVAALAAAVPSPAPPTTPNLAAAPTTPASLPASIPVEYTSNSKYTFLFDSKTGIPISVTTDQNVIAKLEVGGNPVATFPVLSVKTTTTPDSVHDNAHAASTVTTLDLVLTKIVPLVLAILGIALIAVGILRRRPAAAK